MNTDGGHILIVDDNRFNRLLLTRALAEQGHTSVTAENGQQALEALASRTIDVVLLDVLMPEMDGYATLERIKQDPALRHIPVIMVSAVDEMDSVLRCIEMGATDYLPKPFNAALLRARINASLSVKRLRDLELEYLEQVGYVADAAAAVESNTFQDDQLDGVAGRSDALGRLARVFQRMAREVHAREQRLRRRLEQLQLDIEAHQAAAAETALNYLPMDRRHAMAAGRDLPDRSAGTVLFADISGFTPLTETLARELGYQLGVEELTRQLNRIYTVLIDAVHEQRGSVVNFSGDAITCWFDGDTGERAISCALVMQTGMRAFAKITTPAGTAISLVVKIAVAAGPVRRFLVGDPQVQQIEVLAGQILDRVAQGEHLAHPGEVIADSVSARAAGEHVLVGEWRTDTQSGAQFAVITALDRQVPAAAWPALPDNAVASSRARPWLLPAVYEKVRSGKSEFLAEFRSAAALFLKFGGIDYDSDPDAGERLDAFVRWVQQITVRYHGSILQLTIGDKGSYLYIAFGAPISHEDDASRAVNAALELHTPPAAVPGIGAIRIGIAYGHMYSGAYGGKTQRTYGLLGDRVNLSARLMQAATGILCDETIYTATRDQIEFQPLEPIMVKGKTSPIKVYVPLRLKQRIGPLIDSLTPDEQLTLKVASVIGQTFTAAVLRQIYPVRIDATQLEGCLAGLLQQGLLVHRDAGVEAAYAFADSAVQEYVYGQMLFAQRRQLHRAVAEWYEQAEAQTLAAHYAMLARHWQAAGQIEQAITYLERAAQWAQANGALEEAAQYLSASLALEPARVQP